MLSFPPPFLQLIANLRNRHIFVLDVLSWWIAAPLALALRLDGFADHPRYATALIVYLIVASALRGVLFRAFGLYARYWRYASVDELFLIASAVGVTTALLGSVVWWCHSARQHPEQRFAALDSRH
jgi:FlaA1/EpsC-like NDP-sugar epimerase